MIYLTGLPPALSLRDHRSGVRHHETGATTFESQVKPVG